jgi:hypothetical protein
MGRSGDAMVTIHNLEVSFDVQGEGDEAAFAKLFDKYIKRWSRLEAEMKARQRRFETERALVDRSTGAQES